MKSLSLHPLSVLVGLALAGLVVLLLSAAQTAGGAHAIPTTDARLVGEIPAEWWTFVELTGTNGTPVQSYTVPQGHWFVVTGAQGTTYGIPVNADGQAVNARLFAVDTSAGAGNGNGTRVPFGPGTLLENGYGGAGTAIIGLWGYLEPVR